jgi:ABC-type transport system substrate-binding protein
MKKVLTGSIVLLALLTAGGAWGGETVLRVAQVADISNLDPHKMNDIYTANVTKQIFNNLVKMNKDMEIQKDLAAAWENPDTQTWVFHLKKGVKFHNGEEFTANDVKFSLERVLDPKIASPGKRLVSELQKVEVVDRYTVRLVTEKPFAPLLTNLTRYEMAMLNEKAVKAAGDDFGKYPVGTGPFRFKEHHHGDKVILSRFDGYFEGPAKVDTIIYRAIPEDATRVVEMESGGIDIMFNLPPQDFDRLNKNPMCRPSMPCFRLPPLSVSTRGSSPSTTNWCARPSIMPWINRPLSRPSGSTGEPRPSGRFPPASGGSTPRLLRPTPITWKRPKRSSKQPATPTVSTASSGPIHARSARASSKWCRPF